MPDSYQYQGRFVQFPQGMNNYPTYTEHQYDSSDQVYHNSDYEYTDLSSGFVDPTPPVWGTLPASHYTTGAQVESPSVYRNQYYDSSYVPSQGSPSWSSVPSPGASRSSSNYSYYSQHVPSTSLGSLAVENYSSAPYTHGENVSSPLQPSSTLPQHQQLSPRMNPLPPSPQTPGSQVALSPSPGAEARPSSAQEISYDVGHKQLYSHKEQLQFFREALNLPYGPPAGPFVPQLMYKPHTNSDRRRYVEEVDLEAPIYFWVDGPGECGIPLADALHSRVRRLLQRDEPVFEGRGPSVSIRLEWPGYRQWSRQIPTKDFRSPPGPITRAKLAKNVAKCVQRFISERQNHTLEDDVDVRWRVGPGHDSIKLEDLVLVSIHHVSMGSWQPHLRLRRSFST